MTNRIGQQIGNYCLSKLLGTGGFAEVYLGEHILLEGRQVAIKVLRASLPPEYEKLFMEEAKMVANFDYLHIIQLFDFGIQEGSPYLIMQYAPNGTLRNHCPKGSIVPLTTVVAWVIQIAKALQYAHNKDVVHRDVKPENVLILKSGQLVLTDFGVSTVVQETELMKTGHFAGTVIYSAPEQHKGKPRRESDQYALAVMTYEWLCGSVPFQGSSLTEVALKHIQEVPKPLHERVRDIPLAVETVVMKALAKDSKDRFGSVREFALALQEAAKTVAVDALRKKALLLHTQYRLEEAVVVYDQAIGLNPQDAETYRLKGMVLHSFSKYDEALIAFDQAIRFDPQDADAYNQKGDTLKTLGRHEEALAAYDQAMGLAFPSMFGLMDLYYKRGEILSDLGRHEEALVACDQAIRLNPRYEVAYCLKGDILKELRRYKEAVAAYDQVTGRTKRYAAVYYTKAALLCDLRKFKEALIAIDQAITLNPKIVRAYVIRGLVLKGLRRNEEALVALNQAIVLNPELEGAYFFRAMVLIKFRRYEEALADLDQAIRLDSENAETYYEKGFVLGQLGRREEAKQAYALQKKYRKK